MKYRNLIIVAVVAFVIAIILYVVTGMGPYIMGRSPISNNPSQQQVATYYHRPTPWSGECRSGSQTQCSGLGTCSPTTTIAEGQAKFRVQQCIDNFAKACKGTFGSTPISVATNIVDYPFSLGYGIIYYATSNVNCR